VTGNQDGDKAVHDTVKNVVFDCKMISYIDISGVNILKEVLQEYKAVGINVYFACCSRKMKDTLLTAGFFDTFPKEHARTFHNIYKLQKHVLLRHQSYLMVFMGNKKLRFWQIMPL
jgi:MFS superfamily sulfate permease-like transporter